MENTHAPTLPTTYGWYLDRLGQAWRLNAGGWYCASGWSSDDPNFWAPFTHLVPETELKSTDEMVDLLTRALAAIRANDAKAIEAVLNDVQS